MVNVRSQYSVTVETVCVALKLCLPNTLRCRRFIRQCGMNVSRTWIFQMSCSLLSIDRFPLSYSPLHFVLIVRWSHYSSSINQIVSKCMEGKACVCDVYLSELSLTRVRRREKLVRHHKNAFTCVFKYLISGIEQWVCMSSSGKRFKPIIIYYEVPVNQAYIGSDSKT
jgi:hypothetical protein